MNLIGANQFRAAKRAGKEPEAGVFRVTADFQPKAVEGKERTFRFCFSDGSVDRMGDTIDPAGWDINAFMRNPVALWAHDSSQPPIGRASNVLVEDQRLMGDIEFAAPEIYPFAETIHRLVAAKFIRAVSVGFIPKEYDWADDDDREWGLDFKRQELLEISVCPVPANPNALAEARAKGIDTRPLMEWAERTLDGGGKVVIPRADLERLRKAAKEPQMPRRNPAKDAGMSETDPASGGATVGNCGRPADKDCGMKDPAECSIHGFGGAGAGSPEDEDKHMAADIRKLVQQELLKTLKTLRRDPSDGDDPAGAEAPDEPIAKAYAHMKAAGMYHKMAMASHRKALDLLGKAVEGDDDGDEGNDPAKPPDDDGDEEKAIQAEIARLRAI